MNYHLANASNQLLVDTDGLRQELAFKTELLKEQFDLAKNSRYKNIDLTHILTISSLDSDNANTYQYTNDPKNAKRKTATRHFTQLLKMYPEFFNFQLKHNYER